MVQMPIHTEPTDKPLYVRIISDHLVGNIFDIPKSYIGTVGILAFIAPTQEHLLKKHVVISIGNDNYVFDEDDIEYITKKEYFLGLLKYGS